MNDNEPVVIESSGRRYAVDLAGLSGRDLEVEVLDGVYTIKGYY